MEEKPKNLMRKFVLIGRNIEYSFSRDYFKKKFEKEHITDATYQNFDISEISRIKTLFSNGNIIGANVTIPYKEEIIPYLDSLNKHARNIGAVNTIKVSKTNKLKGYNTDYIGFKKSLKPLLESHHKKALILGSGGASKAIAYALKKMDIPYSFVSRTKKSKDYLGYSDLDKSIMESHQIIINTTPLGTFPNIASYPNIHYTALSKHHLLYDLTYNPAETKFMQLGQKQGCKTTNGLKMLEIQAEKAWKIWNS